jgi:hypothetical protein
LLGSDDSIVPEYITALKRITGVGDAMSEAIKAARAGFTVLGRGIHALRRLASA